MEIEGYEDYSVMELWCVGRLRCGGMQFGWVAAWRRCGVGVLQGEIKMWGSRSVE